MSSIQLPPPPRDTYEVEVPLPPTDNNLFPTGPHGKRFKSREYRAWIEATERTFARLFVCEVFPVEIGITLRGKVNRQRDVGNNGKAIIDAVVAAGVIPDDSLKYVSRVDLCFEPDDGEPRTVVTVYEPEPETPELFRTEGNPK